MLVLRRLLVASVLVGTVACNGAGNETGESDSTSPATTTGTVTSCLDHSSTVRRHTPVGSGDVFLVDARVSRIDECVDEVTFEFRSDGRPLPPGYSVEYDEGPFVDFTSGDEFEPAGEAYLVLRFAKTAVFAPTLPGAPPEPTYTGRESIDPSGMNHLREARIVQGSDGRIQWVIGLDSERPFNVDGSSLALLPPPESTTTTSASGTSTTTTTAATSTTTPTAATSKIVVRIG
jgi:hypothetical protein